MGNLASISAAHVAFKAHDNSEPSSLTTCIGSHAQREMRSTARPLVLCRISLCSNLDYDANLGSGEERQLQHALCSLAY